MRKIKASSSYLKNQVRKNLAKAVLSILLFIAVLAALTYRILTKLQISILEVTALVFLLVLAIATYTYLHKYHVYNSGWQGEKSVTKLLSSKLNDDYYLVNDLSLQNGGGDIDHVVLGPNGIFVLETKNWSGNITCNGDNWQRTGKRGFSAQPSHQAKRNAMRIKRLIDNSASLRSLNVWVEGIVVFTNKHATLHLNNPTVPVLKLQNLPHYIITHSNTRRYSAQELQAIAKEIIKQKQ
ncbi:MAG: NERD domain-containing protein [Candidatus Bathyarchaeota archaeon]|nr:NERD domain-containing protein [Candidatus Bathyarchaeota archaeon]